MTFLILMAQLALLASSTLARPQPGTGGHKAEARAPCQKTAADTTTDRITSTVSKVTLSPVNWTDHSNARVDALTPQPNITLKYGQGNNSTNDGAAVVNITLATNYDGVLLEAIESLASVDCSNEGVSLTFSDADTLDSAYNSWSGYEQLLLVTNHVGDCDTEYERGFFVSSSLEKSEGNLTLVAGAARKNVTDVASYMRANFSGLPSPTPLPTKRDLVLDPDDITASAAFTFGPVTLYSYEDVLTVTADTASVDVAVTLGGYLDFDIGTASLAALRVDVATSASAALVLGLNATAPYQDTFSYSAGYEGYLVDVLGLLTLGPAVALAVGADVDARGAVDVTLGLGAAFANATLRLDLAGGEDDDGVGVGASGWGVESASYHVNLTLSEEAALGVTPFVSVEVEIDFEILGGLLDLSGGLTPKISFPTTITLDAGQDVGVGSGTNETVTVTQPVGGGCSNGVEVDSDFDFTLEAFVTEFWSSVLYNYTVNIADECYSWT